jgi:hypothetical protein
VPTVHSHYENLKVARNAPIEVIRAAYRTLSQKYHPDKNPGDAEAARIMALINSAYETLSDPVRRLAHDKWIAQAEANQTTRQTSRGSAFTIDESKPRAQPPRPRPSSITAREIFGHILRYWFLYAILLFVGFAVLEDKPKSPPPGPKPYVASRPYTYIAPPPPANIQIAPTYQKPLSAPNGEPWPTSAGYVRGYPVIHKEGLSQVTIDNSQNDADVFVKLVSLDDAQAFPVRVFYIPGYQSFTVHKVNTGNYDLRYRDLNTGTLLRTESFTLEEVPIENGVRYSSMTMTLYKVPNGNLHTYELSESEF